MCIISGQVHYVANTRIFAYPYDDRQMTVYQNQVGTGKPALMILPVPYPDSIRFEETVMKTPDFFGLCERSFTVEHTLSVTRSLSAEPLQPKSYLEVRNVGPYAVSVATSVEDIKRLDPSIFQLEDELTFLLQGQYPSPFGFLCCILRRGEQKYEPLAYSHRRLFPDRLFIPTLHYHTHPGYTLESNLYEENWSHDIYTLMTRTEEAHTDSKYRSRVPNELATDRFPSSDYRGLKMLPLRKWSKHGPYKNVDLEFQLEHQPWRG